MTNRRTVKKTIYVVAIVLLIILPLVIGAGFVFWASADKSGGGYRFFEGLFGERYEAEQAYYTYDSQYASAKAVDPDFKSPVYVLGDSILENIPVSDYASRLPQNAVRELYIPADMRYEGIGLFSCYIDHNNDFAIQKTTTEAGLQLFDTSKPTLIFIHGMQLNDGSYKDENSSYLKPFIQGGYNVLLFRWSQLADESTPMEIEPKLWGTTQDKSKNLYGMRWRDNDPKHSYREDDIPNASVAEIFGAYYIDLMSRFDYTGRSIQLTGHSMGGQVAFAVASFLLTKEQEGLMPPAYLPDKVTVFDPYIAPFRNEVFCDWLGIHITRPMYDNEGNPVYSPKTNEQKYTSAINVIADTAQALTDRGIACEYVPAITGYVHFLLYGLDPNEPAVDKFFENCVVLNFRSDWAPKTDFNGFHGAGRNWYFQTVLRGYYYDHAMNNTIDYAPSANIPLSYFFARTGTKYDMQENMTKDDIDDDMLYGENIAGAQVAGFAFEDTNGNQSYDERLQARMANVKVELYLKNGHEDKLIATCITDEAGFYSFHVPFIYANGFDLFYIRTLPPKGYEICGRGSAYEMMNNDINPSDNRSDNITLKHYKNLKIINIGLVKEAE